ncbi:MAG: hypothetical protein A2283_19530 [Lentisphaerae bacterium RIFOXYA12_FULL_48_11]|nr:MAG: hypothetical protein A2283_19530 [Lentisphaerae bacterium RIFOXYA12_FULL_48_11]
MSYMMDEQQLNRRLHLVEALYTGAMGMGEKTAAAEAMQRLHRHLDAVQKKLPLIEHEFSLSDIWPVALNIQGSNRDDLEAVAKENDLLGLLAILKS